MPPVCPCFTRPAQKKRRYFATKLDPPGLPMGADRVGRKAVGFIRLWKKREHRFAPLVLLVGQSPHWRFGSRMFPMATSVRARLPADETGRSVVRRNPRGWVTPHGPCHPYGAYLRGAKGRALAAVRNGPDFRAQPQKN